MADLYGIPPYLISVLKERFKEKYESMRIPPTAFVTMKGELIDYDLDNSSLKAKFPVLDNQLNQFGNMQGGMIAAAIDNTLGPLSMLVAPPNFTRTIEIKYIKPINPSIEFIYVIGELVDKKRRKLYFNAKVIDKNDVKMAQATAVHWILGEDQR